MRALTALLALMSSSVMGGVPPTETHQVLYLADSGVVVLQMSVVIDGQTPKQRLEAYVDSFLKKLDKNGDGIVTVEESKGKILSGAEAQRLQLAVSDGPAPDVSPDFNPKDGKITRTELMAYFKRIGVLPFSVKFQPRTAAQPDPNTGAMTAAGGAIPLFEKLDVDGDRKLSVAELENALEVLRKLDRDDDETISAVELLPLATQPTPANRQAMNNAPAPSIPFISLASSESLPKLIRKIVDKYDSADGAKSGVPSLSTKNQKLSRMELGLAEATFSQFDVDSDGQLDFAELRQFVTACQPDLQIQLDISHGKVEVAGSQSIEVRMTPDGAANIQIGSAQLSVSAIPPAPQAVAESMIKPLFMAFDGDANGYLEKMEVPDNALPGATFADLDGDKNGKLFLEEVVDFMQPRLELAQNRLELTITEQGRTLFDILDADRDGRLARREIRKVRGKLNLWDSNQDGFLEESEIPLQFTMVAGQGTLPIFGIAQSDDARSSRTPNAARPNGPTWFTKMDRNRDGEVSRREFLGDPELFQRLDLNQDGAIELTEALMVKAN